MKCPNIENLTFSPASISGLKKLREMNEVSKLLATATGVGAFANIFVGNNVIAATYSLYSHDFDTMSKSLQAISNIQRVKLAEISINTWQKVSNYKEKQFWKAIHYGCKVE